MNDERKAKIRRALSEQKAAISDRKAGKAAPFCPNCRTWDVDTDEAGESRRCKNCGYCWLVEHEGE